MVERATWSRAKTKSQVMKLIVLTEIAYRIRPGHCVYLTFPALAGRPSSLFQAHPYVVAWREGSECSFLIQRESGLSNDIFNMARPGLRVLIDGPYGQVQSFERYEKVLFVASGIGVAAHYLSVRALIEAELTKTTCMCAICMSEDDPTRLKQYLEMLYKSGELLLRLLTDLLVFSKNEMCHPVRLQEKKFRLKTLSSQILVIFGQQAEQAGIELSVDKVIKCEVDRSLDHDSYHPPISTTLDFTVHPLEKKSQRAWKWLDEEAYRTALRQHLPRPSRCVSSGDGSPQKVQHWTS
ncbi:Histidine kinase [Curvularia kusanoi]|uniref:ferric-chelate reductase (NADPH) n=1 Tax=Curvularia kusanoi TaxID=90978 RepID=A0A9P4WCD3_CURKU|nr:Histidine kinase [Curvularia kusanoi]